MTIGCKMTQMRKFLLLLFVCVAANLIYCLQAPLPTINPDDIPTSNDLPPRQRNKGEENDYFEGDIRLRPGEDPYNVLDSNFVGGNPRLWRNGEIPFAYKPNLIPLYRTIFREAMDEWEAMTCLEFVAKTDNDMDYLYFTDEQDCSSYVGRKGGAQEVSINHRCDRKGHAAHQIGHAIGLWHEQSRPDRDNYIAIIWKNIQEHKQMCFGRLSEEEFQYVPDVGYDLESIMHYGSYAFSIDKENSPTIIPLVDLPSCALGLGQRKQLSYRDKLRVNKLYQCTEYVARLERQGPDCDLDEPDPNPLDVPPTTPAEGTTTTRPSQ